MEKITLIKCIIISLFLLFISNILTTIFIFNLNVKVNTINKNYGLSKFSKINKEKQIEINKESNLNKLNETFNNNIMKEYIDHQKNFARILANFIIKNMKN